MLRPVDLARTYIVSPEDGRNRTERQEVGNGQETTLAIHLPESDVIGISDHTRLLEEAQAVSPREETVNSFDLPEAPMVMPLQNLDPALSERSKLRLWRLLRSQRI